MSKTESITLSEDDEILEHQMLRQLPQISANEAVEQQQRQEHEQPMMMVPQAVLQIKQTNQQIMQMQQKNQKMMQAQQHINKQLLHIQQQNDYRFAAQDIRLDRLEIERGCDGPVLNHRAVKDTEAAEANAGVAPNAGQRHRTRYTPDEDLRIVRYLVKTNKIDRAKSTSVWEEMRNDDPVIARRSVGSLQQRFRLYIWPDVMAGRYTKDPRILDEFSGIWPGRVFQAP